MDYILIILCGVLPLIFKRTWWVRLVSIVLLCGFSLFFFMGLQTSSRLASSKEYKETQQAPSDEWMNGAMKTRLIVQKSLPQGLLLFAALIILASKPIKEK
jgi:Ca2+/Na+ antiporter